MAGRGRKFFSLFFDGTKDSNRIDLVLNDASVAPGEEFVGADDADAGTAACEFGPVEGRVGVGIFEVLPTHADFQHEEAAFTQVVARFV